MEFDEVQIEQRGELAIIAVESPMLTSLEADHLLQVMREYHKQAGCGKFVIEMSNVDFIDSACIGSLVTFLIEIDKDGGRLMLSGCQRSVEDLLKITGLTTHIKLVTSLEQAEREAA